MSLSFDDLNGKYRNLSVLCVIGGLIFGLILGVLIIGNFFVFLPSVVANMFLGAGMYIVWCVAIVIALIVTAIIIYRIKKLNKSIKEYKNGDVKIIG